MCERHKVAGSAKRTLHVDNRIDIVVEEVDKAVDGHNLTAREAVAQRLNLEQQHNLDDVVRHSVACAACMRHHKIDLKLCQVVRTDADVTERSETGGNAVNGRLVLCYLTVEILTAFYDTLLRVVAQLNLVTTVYYLTYTFN